MAEETFWIVQWRHKRDRKWRNALWTLQYQRKSAIATFLYKYKFVKSWERDRRRGLVRCIKVRVVPVKGAGVEG